MFKAKLIELCNQKGVAPTVACEAIGLSNSVYSMWKDDSMPRKATILKFASYFGVDPGYFTSEEKRPDDKLTKLAALMNQMDEEQVKQLSDYADFLMSKRK